MKKENIYLVEWHDAHSQGGWHTDDEIKKFIEEDKCICLNVGFILSETKDEIVMAARKLRWKEDSEDGKWAKWGDLQKIPKSWIRKKVIWKIK